MPTASATPLHRHDFVWLRPGTRVGEGVTCDRLDETLVADWLARQRPLVVCRRPARASALPGEVALGLALPGKRRIALAARARAIARVDAPPAIARVAARAPAQLRAALARLGAAAEAAAIDLRVFGSFAWQALCGLSYVTAASDVDVIWRARTRADVEAGVALLQAWEQSSGLRADGEIVFGDDDAVAWREWSCGSAPARVMVKRLHAAELRAPSELLANLGPVREARP